MGLGRKMHYDVGLEFPQQVSDRRSVGNVGPGER
jgi:hypothetical protein